MSLKILKMKCIIFKLVHYLGLHDFNFIYNTKFFSKFHILSKMNKNNFLK